MMKFRIPSLALLIALLVMATGCDSATTDNEEGGTQYKLTEEASQTRSGVDLIMTYDQNTQKFNGTVTNTTSAAISDVRVEIHLSNGQELGPTPNTVLKAKESQMVTLDAKGERFDWWSVHVEIGQGEGED